MSCAAKPAASCANKSPLEMNAMNATAADWTHIEPLLDEAMHALDDTDRTAVLLRLLREQMPARSRRTPSARPTTPRKSVSAAPSNACANSSPNAASPSARADSSSSSPPTPFRPRPLDWPSRFQPPPLLPEQPSHHDRNCHRHESHRHDHTQKTLVAATLAAAVGTGSTKPARLQRCERKSNAPAATSAACRANPATDQRPRRVHAPKLAALRAEMNAST